MSDILLNYQAPPELIFQQTGIPGSSIVPRLSLGVSSSGLPVAGAELGRYYVAEDLLLSDLLSGGRASVGPSTAAREVQVMSDGGMAAFFRWEIGQTLAAVTILIPAISTGDLLIFKAPVAQDPAFSGVAVNLVATRV